MSDEFDVRPATGYALFRNGRRIVDTHGTPILYDTEEGAQHVADNWDQHRAPTHAELKAMSDDDLRAEADRLIREGR